MTGLNRGELLGALSGPRFFTPISGSNMHLFISFFTEIILTSCCKATCLPSPVYSIGVASPVFFKNFPISETVFLMASIVDMKGILVDCGKI